jgi:MFS family permease
VQQQEIQAKPPSLWHHANFRRLWISDTISQFGGQFGGFAIPTIAAYVLGADPLQVSLLVVAGFISWPLFALPIGAWIDQRKRRPIMIAANIGRAVSLGMVPLVWVLGGGAGFKSAFSNFNPFNLYTLYIIAFFVGLFGVFFDISYQAYLPSLVDRDQLVEGNSKLQMSQSTAQAAGPTISTSTIKLVTIPASPIVCLGDAIGFSASALFLRQIDKEEPMPKIVADRPSFTNQIREGLMVVFRDSRLTSIAASTSTSNLFGNAIFPLLLLFARDELKLTESTALGVLGIAGSIGALGGLLGAVTAGRLARRVGVGRVIILSIFIAQAGSLLLAYLTPEMATPYLGLFSPFLIAVFFLGAWGSVVYNVNQVSLRQAIVPLKIQGRMNASMRWLVWGTIPLGAIMGGVLAEVFGLRQGITIAAFGGLLAAVWVLIGPVRNLKTIPSTPADEPTAA